MVELGKRITKIEELAKKSRDPHKGEELQVADRFIEYYNNTYRTDYILSKSQPVSIDDKIDIFANSKSDSGKILEIQVKTFDSRFRATVNKCSSGEFLRIVNQTEKHPLISEFRKSIPKLEIKYKNTNNGLVILFDGFWGFNLGEKLAEDLKKLFTNKRFKEVWIVYSGKNCIRLL
jgi:hypothetical protein